MPADDIASVLGRVASGVYILTARHGEQETGMVASWVMQAGFEPPMVTVALARKRYLCDWFDAGATLALNLVAAGQTELLKHFGRGFEPGEPAFAGIEVEHGPGDEPLLPTALGHLICIPREHVDSGDHRIYLCEITSARLHHDAPPMTHVRKNGLKY